MTDIVVPKDKTLAEGLIWGTLSMLNETAPKILHKNGI